jgi:hypothetical protein
MEDGLLLDYQDGNRAAATSWVARPVERSFWFGLKVRGKPRFEVRAFRCPRCGYLECYANDAASGP